MVYFHRYLFAILIVGLVGTVLAADDEKPLSIKGWGKVIDTAGDCSVQGVRPSRVSDLNLKFLVAILRRISRGNGRQVIVRDDIECDRRVENTSVERQFVVPGASYSWVFRTL